MAGKLPKMNPPAIKPANCRRLIVDFNLEVVPPYLEIAAAPGEVYSGPTEPAYILTLALQQLLLSDLQRRAGVIGGNDGGSAKKKSD